MIICFDVCVHNVGTYILHIVNDITIPKWNSSFLLISSFFFITEIIIKFIVEL